MKNKKAMKTSLLGFLLNILLAGLKTMAGIFSRSNSLLVDGVNSFSDALSSLIALFSLWYAKRPADKDHPYGHDRMETIGGFLVTMIMIVLGVELLKSSFKDILNPKPLLLNNIIFIMTVVSMFIKFGVTMLYYKNRHLSKIMIVNAKDGRNDLLMSTAVLLSLLLESFFKIQIDGYLAFVLALFIIISALSMVKSFVNDLLGARPDDKLLKDIQTLLNEESQILGYHDLLVHQYGSNRIYVSVDVELDQSISLAEAHEIIDSIERTFEEKHAAKMTIHLDPINLKDKKLQEVAKMINNTLKEDFKGCAFHDLRCADCDGYRVHIVSSNELSVSHEEIELILNDHLKELCLGENISITWDEHQL